MRDNKRTRGQRGAVMMEYVIIAVLIAAACVLGVVTFSRSIAYGFAVSAKGATGDSADAKTSQQNYRQQLDDDSQKAKDYHDSMHTGQ